MNNFKAQQWKSAKFIQFKKVLIMKNQMLMKISPIAKL